MQNDLHWYYKNRLHLLYTICFRIWRTSLWDSPNKTHPALWFLLSASLLLNLNSGCLLRNQTHNNQNYTGQRFVFISVWLFLFLTFSVFSFLSSLRLSWSQWTAAPVGCRVRNYKWQTTDFRHTWVRVCETCVLLSSLSSLGDLAGLWEFVTRLLTAIQMLIYLKSFLHTVTQTHFRAKELDHFVSKQSHLLAHCFSRLVDACSLKKE